MVVALKSSWNAANAVTVVRIALVPFFAWALLADGGHEAGWRWCAATIFLLAAATDRLDGWLARRSGQVTDLGKLLDPIADKLLVGTALVLLSWLGDLWWWVTALILVRELGITLMRFAVLKYAVMPASRGGKLKTVLQAAAIGLYLLPLDTLPGWIAVLAAITMGAALVVTVVTGVEYAYQGWRLRRAGKREQRRERAADPDAGPSGA
ncbi:CDP-diacylglycerol--glycerol-3-phosphate 3-phosphatidyltransferase/cardiolipin synthase [Sediminihabitans luteus]|uniref:CDP-diacylglycerol--glycerol-3-phosphate 3-phosphatidyltransferase n=1 Tax=Sediminihabitans luteus TaxID=1138585 RepID=A0A2M9CCE3_9CELL|nr:CDP-diacylglycerol--glycerol-3-phosphate 3-phosphatidyltransferase [Sediminihabitans luteus]PJJ69034.1 CDP-diacylglycerol--glycerol-3-phosphate 3-phosphatidyltransferase/cardiolipin synthase [Sediminihabitans luteus]GII99420.1 CDP-diacylglycerol--glycerol-3-phosphate 3-phosphatidyltransferase [Sediminihabitans luteus]